MNKINQINSHKKIRRIRLLIAVVIIGLIISGATAIPLEAELTWLASLLHSGIFAWVPAGFVGWIERVRDSLVATNSAYPFMAYGTDWLAFGHFAIAIAFIGP